MRKGIELPKETIEGMLSGASMFIVPVVAEERIINYYKSLEDKYKQELTKICSPLQIDDEFYVQEDFSIDEILLGGEELLYQFDFAPRDFRNCAIGYGLTTDKMKERILERCEWKDASQMTYDQSRVKGKVDNVEVIKIQEICNDEKYGDLKVDGCVYIENNMADEKERKTKKFRKFKQMHKDIYEDNPYVFIYTFKGI